MVIDMCYFAALPPYIEPPNDIPPLDLALQFDFQILLAINYTAINGGTSEECQIERGMVIGRLNCQPVTASIRLAVHNGQLVSRVSLSAKRKPVAVGEAAD
jgi:hypothetical protein